MTPLRYYQTRYPGEGLTPETIVSNVRETCLRLGWTEAEILERPEHAGACAVGVWLECERISEMTGDTPVEEY